MQVCTAAKQVADLSRSVLKLLQVVQRSPKRSELQPTENLGVALSLSKFF